MKEAARRGLIDHKGTGRKNDPYRYALKGQQFALEDLEPSPLGSRIEAHIH